MAVPNVDQNPSTIGMMSKELCVPRKELVDWLQRDFDCCIEKVESCGTGAMYLQIMDKAYPGRVPMQKVIWNATQDYEMTRNFKLLQDVFAACDLQRAFNIDLLTKQRCQENLSFLQWMKVVYDRRLAEIEQLPYNAYERRLLGTGPMPEWALPRRAKGRDAQYQTSDHRLQPKPTRQLGRPLAQLGRKASGQQRSSGCDKVMTTSTTSSSGDFRRPLIFEPKDGEAKMRQLKREVEDLHETIADLSRSKDFYHNKLIAIEAYCSASSGDLDREVIEHILFAETMLDAAIDHC